MPRAYAWGAPGAISELLGRVPTGAPEAELWLGTHPASPAMLSGGGLLVDISGELPYLLKILSAAAPLSLQVHPDLDQARAGFAREQAAGIPIDAPDRNYRDQSAKPELLYALTEFWALSGFRSIDESRAALASLSTDSRISPLLSRLVSATSLGSTVAWLLEHGPGADDAVTVISERAAEIAGSSGVAARLLAAHYPGDVGIAISQLLNTVVLQPGEALYLPAGNLHAYLYGTGIELMGASDNVLRGGLTEKHMDVAELLSVLDARPLPVPLVLPTSLAPGVVEFQPPGSNLRLVVADASATRRGVGIALGGPSIAIALGGPVLLDDELMPAGTAAYLADLPRVHAVGAGLLMVASAAIPGRVDQPPTTPFGGGLVGPRGFA